MSSIKLVWLSTWLPHVECHTHHCDSFRAPSPTNVWYFHTSVFWWQWKGGKETNGFAFMGFGGKKQLKGNWYEDTKLAFKWRMLAFKYRQSANVSTCSPHLIVLSIFTQESFFSFKYLSFSGLSHTGSPFLSMVSRNGLTRYIIIWFLRHTFLPCSWHQGYRLLPRTHSHAFATFKH